MEGNADGGGGGDVVGRWSGIARRTAHLRPDIGFAFVDAGAVLVAYLAAFAIRFFDQFGVPSPFLGKLLVALPIVAAVHVGLNLAFGAYGHVLESVSASEGLRLVAASSTAAFVLLVLELAVQDLAADGVAFVPISVIALGAVLATAGMGLIRLGSYLAAMGD